MESEKEGGGVAGGDWGVGKGGGLRVRQGDGQ